MPSRIEAQQDAVNLICGKKKNDDFKIVINYNVG